MSVLQIEGSEIQVIWHQQAEESHHTGPVQHIPEQKILSFGWPKARSNKMVGPVERCHLSCCRGDPWIQKSLEQSWISDHKWQLMTEGKEQQKRHNCTSDNAVYYQEYTEKDRDVPEMCTKLEELMQQEEISITPDMSKDAWKHSTLKLLEVADSPSCNNADIDCYVKMLTIPPPVDPNIERLLELCEEEDASLAPIFPTIYNCLLHWVAYVCIQE